MRPAQFVKAVQALNFEDTFNPYADICPIYDLEDAPSRRSKTLNCMIEAATKTEIDAIWIGRDLGYRGGRRTGLAFTDDMHFQAHATRWGVSVDRPTKGLVIAERTAAVIWSVLSQINQAIFLWNVFPLHPHGSDNPFSNRLHNSCERKAGEEVLHQIILLLKPRRLIAIGNDAAQTANKMTEHHEVIKVRHPSYGGRAQFLKQIKALYKVTEGFSQGRLF